MSEAIKERTAARQAVADFHAKQRELPKARRKWNAFMLQSRRIAITQKRIAREKGTT